MEYFVAGTLITLAILAAVAGLLAVSNAKLWIKIGAIEKSTHQMTIFNPSPEATPEFQKMTKALRDKLEADDAADMDSLA